MRLHPDNSARTRHEIRNFLEGPIYVLLLKVPISLIGIILYVIYGIAKFIVKQLSKVFAALAIYTAYLLVDSVGYHLVFICKHFPAYLRYFGAKFYRNILRPVKFFTHNSILLVMYDVSEWILDTILWFGVWCYQQIILPVVRFCYIRVIAPIPTWMNELSIVFRSTLRLLFRRFCSACIWAWQHILYPLCLFIFIDIPLTFYQNVFKIGSLIYTGFFIPFNRCIKYMVPIIYDYLRKLFVYVSTCASFYRYILLHFCQTFSAICPSIHREVLKSVSRLVLIVRTICDRLYQFILYPTLGQHLVSKILAKIQGTEKLTDLGNLGTR